MSKRPKLGDVIEISLANAQFGYAQYTHKHPQYGALLRVFDIREKVTDSSSFFSNGILFSVFFPLGAAINRNIVSVVANLPIRLNFNLFQLFVLELLINKEALNLGGFGMVRKNGVLAH